MSRDNRRPPSVKLSIPDGNAPDTKSNAPAPRPAQPRAQQSPGTRRSPHYTAGHHLGYGIGLGMALAAKITGRNRS